MDYLSLVLLVLQVLEAVEVEVSEGKSMKASSTCIIADAIFVVGLCSAGGL